MLKLMEVGHFYQAYYQHDKFVWKLHVYSILNSHMQEEFALVLPWDTQTFFPIFHIFHLQMICLLVSYM